MQSILSGCTYSVGIAFSPNEGLKLHRYNAQFEVAAVGIAFSPNEGLKQFHMEKTMLDI